MPMLSTPQLLLLSAAATAASPGSKIFTAEAPAAVPKVFSLQPASATSTGGVQVTVHGEGFLRSNDLRCRFGDLPEGSPPVVKAQFLSTKAVLCITPPHPLGPVVVAVANADEFSQEPATLQFVTIAPPPAKMNVMEVKPRLVPVGQQAAIKITVANEMKEAICQQGKFLSDAISLGKGVYRCQVMATEEGPVPVELRSTASEFLPTPLQLTAQKLLVPQVTALSASNGFNSGGTRVQVHGFGFVDNPSLKCKFGEVVSDAVFVSTRVIRCPAPEHPASIVAVEVTNDGNNWSSNKVGFEFTEPIKIASVFPQVLPSHTAMTDFTVKGNGFVDSPQLLCKFGNISSVPARFVSTQQVACKLPSLWPDKQMIPSVAVSNNAVDYVTAATQLKFAVEAGAVTISSPPVVALGGNVMATIHGTNFVQSPSLHCLIDGYIRSKAKFIDTNNVQCLMPAHAAGLVSLRVLNGEERVDTLVEPSGVLTYPNVPTVTNVYPLFGTVSGNTPIFVRGSGFLNVSNSYLQCRVGDAVVPAEFMDANNIRCVTVATTNLSEVTVSATNDGATFSTQPIKFKFLPMPVVEKVTPREGHVEGGTSVLVTGNNFFDSVGGNAIMCSFNGKLVTSTFLNNKKLRCKVPKASSDGKVNFSLWIDGNIVSNIGTSGIDFTYFGGKPEPALTMQGECTGDGC